MSRRRTAQKRYEYARKLTNQECRNIQEDNIYVSKNSKNKIKKLTLKLFFAAIGRILKGNVDTQGELTTGSFAILSAAVFKLIAIAGITFAGVFAWALGNAAIASTWIGWGILTNAIEVLAGIVMLFAIVIYSVFLWGASNEIMKEKDKNFVIAVFSGMVGFAALIVALVALFQGVS